MGRRVRERGTEGDLVAEAVVTPVAPATPGVAELLALQRSAGNAAVARMLARQGSALAEEIPPAPAYEDDVPPPPGLFGEDEEAIPGPPLHEEDDDVPPPPQLEEDDDVPPP